VGNQEKLCIFQSGLLIYQFHQCAHTNNALGKNSSHRKREPNSNDESVVHIGTEQLLAKPKCMPHSLKPTATKMINDPRTASVKGREIPFANNDNQVRA
jgi:hypothetical protein